jgi:hypothetical protein
LRNGGFEDDWFFFLQTQSVPMIFHLYRSIFRIKTAFFFSLLAVKRSNSYCERQLFACANPRRGLAQAGDGRDKTSLMVGIKPP